MLLSVPGMSARAEGVPRRVRLEPDSRGQPETGPLDAVRADERLLEHPDGRLLIADENALRRQDASARAASSGASGLTSRTAL